MKTGRLKILLVDNYVAVHEEFRKIFAIQDAADVSHATLGHTNNAESLLRRICSSGKFDVETALRGETGYQKIIAALQTDSPFALVFCDAGLLTGFDGPTMAGRIWQADPNLSLVLYSANSKIRLPDSTNRLFRSRLLWVTKTPFDQSEILQLSLLLTEKRRLLVQTTQLEKELATVAADYTTRLSESRREADNLLDAIDSLMISTEANGTIKRWNKNAESVFGLTADKAIGVKLAQLDICWENRDFLKTLGDPQHNQIKRLEAKFYDSENSTRIVGLSSYSVYNHDSEFVGKLILGTDITEHRAHEQQLQTTQKLESVGVLAAGVAHEINTPMQYIGDNLNFLADKYGKIAAHLTSYGELLEHAAASNFEPALVHPLREQRTRDKLEKLTRQFPEALADAVGGVKHVSRIVQAMKELSYAGEEERSLVDINKALVSMFTVSKHEWKYIAELEADLDPDLALVSGFPGEINQVFLNLFVNAAHAISEFNDAGKLGKGKITVRTRQGENSVRIEISDTGGGIPQAIQKKVFDPFFTTKAVGKGTGQGLAISHSVIVQKHNGQISFDVDDGIGTTFIIELPTVDEAGCSYPLEATATH